jgi:RNA polymerase sigma-70 factor (ECF subfamily)
MTLLRMRPAEDAADREFRAVVEEHAPAVHAYLRRKVADAGRAEDLTQEVFLRAWRHAGRFDPSRADLRGWLFAIARNLVIDAHRADGARPRTAAGEEVLVALPAPDEIDAAVGAWAMSDALRRLTPAHRDVLLCLYYRRWTLAETASHLDIAVGTVKSRSTYALRALRLVLEEMEVPT